MKRCPTCNRTYTDTSLNFCLEDGTPLTADAPPVDPNATIRYPAARDTSEPPPTEIYRPQPPPPIVSPRPTTPPPPPPPTAPQWTPTPLSAPPRKKSNAIWWILGLLAAFIVIGGGLLVMVLVLANLNSNSNTNNLNANTTRNENRNSNVTANTPPSNINASSNVNASIPNSLVDDFSQEKWGTGTSPYGRIWYSNGEYHMTSREKTFVVMYAPSDEYSTENATVKVTARSVNGDVPSSGFGLMVHCAQSKTKQLEDYAILIYPSTEPEYEIIKHKNGVQSSVVTKTKSSAIKSGSAPNVLEVRIRGTELSFYANGQFLTKITDSENYKKGRTGFYTSDAYEVAFDDLSINR
jgi:cytoskeletal protein RodZ